MEGAAQSIVSNVGQLVAKEFWLLRGIGGEVIELRDELATMNALLMQSEDDEREVVDHVVREWMKQVRELACDADDCVDLYIFRIKRRPSDGFFVKSRRLLTTLYPRRLLAGDIRALRSRAIAISERHARYSSSRTVQDPYLSSHAPAPAVTGQSTQRLRPGRADANDPDEFVGVEELNTLINMVEGEKDDGQLNVFSIVGFGGLGKTTLAFEVFRQLKTKFQCQAQVSVSRAFDSSKDLRGLLKLVFQQILKVNDEGIEMEKLDSVGNIDEMDVNVLTNKLKEHLEGKRYLIVLDDVWTVAVWAAIRSKLPESTCGSIIIVTTRIDSVAQACSGASVCEDHIYHMKPLSCEDSKKLFLRRVFGFEECSFPRELEDELHYVLKKCSGHPLAIVSIGSLLANYRSPDSKGTWEYIRRSMGSHIHILNDPTPDGLRKIITVSFHHLPRDLKRCMMYLCIFPENYLISKNRLLKRWIAEGLIPEKQGLTLMETAESYYNELVNRGMIDQAGCIVTYCNRMDMCRVHDIMLEVMASKSLELNFVSLVGIQYEAMSYDIVRRLSIHGADGANGIEGMNVQHVRSLSTFQSEGHKLLLDQLGKFKLLRVLDLEDCKDLKNKHLRYICKMYLLKFLSLRGTDISMMPREVCDLEHLQTLDVGDTLLGTLPNTMTKLIKLEQLMFSNRERLLTLWILPKGISKMKALREVSRVAIENVEVAIEIGDLQQLELIFVYVNKSSKQSKDIIRELNLSLSKTAYLQWLHVGELRDVHTNNMDNHPLDLDMPSQLLRYLGFGGFIPRIPDWVGSLAFLAEFTISSTKLAGNQPFEVLCKARNLNHITFQMDFYIDKDLVARSAHKFSALKSVRVISAAETPEMFSFEEDSMTQLEILEVDFGDWQKSIIGIEHLTNLKQVRLSGSSNNASLMEVAEKLKEESDRRGKSDDYNQRPFTVGVRYN
ncbi:hypothetical protein CFC21_045686 [Triticum aestivum]|uniref:Uncharacterized protein n=2 Tax=Triticum aestivum TaxID=4565 RepID=A0A3B6GMQ3_WHEAT|nr:disease resistance protein Pik-2-like [Triticum aestivum]KAF7034705.1 hypothetical protein CFC21_045686 [Triticum aestivum]